MADLVNITMLAAGGQHTLALASDGTVWAWGSNWCGQLGDGTNEGSLIPVRVAYLTNVVAIAAGVQHSIALKEDGTVWTWGSNSFGELGDGTTSEGRNVPVQVVDLAGVTAVAAGDYHSLALKSDGTVWAWGVNFSGELGDGTTKERDTPVRVADLVNITMVTAGGHHTLALKEDGTVWTWGNNTAGQLGDGTWTFERLSPVPVTNLTGVTAVSGGNGHSMALKGDGTVWTWGDNWSGQLGDGTRTNRNVPVQVVGLVGATAVSGGNGHSMALKEDGTVWTWGDNSLGQLGDGTTHERHTPVQVVGVTDATVVSGGGFHSVVIAGPKLFLHSVYFLSAMVRAGGARGTEWKSDIMIYNPNEETACYDLFYAPGGQSGVNLAPCETRCLNSGEVYPYHDVIPSACGISDDTAGNLRVEGDHALMVTSRTYNDQPDGTYGQFIPCATEADAVENTASWDGETSYIPGLTNNEDFRTNFGFTEVMGQATPLELMTYDPEGQIIGSAQIQVPPYGWNQMSWTDLGFSTAADAYATIEVSTGGGILAYASVVDNRTGDATYIPAERRDSALMASVKLIPVVAHAPGGYGTQWRSDIWLLNMTSGERDVPIKYVTASGTYFQDAFIAPGQQEHVPDAIAHLFPEIEESSVGSLHLSCDSGFWIMAASRTYNQTDGGTYGQYIPARAESEFISLRDAGILLQLACDEAYRTNIGFSPYDDQMTQVQVTLHDVNGTSLGEKIYIVHGIGNHQVNNIFADMGVVCNYDAAYATVEVLSGSNIYAYASVVDNRTGDAVFIPAR